MADSFEDAKRRVFDALARFREEHYYPTPPGGLTPNEARTLTKIDDMASDGKTSLRPRELARRLKTSPSSLSQTMRSMEQKGLIERSRSAEDCRAIEVRLTDAGQDMAKECRALRDRHMDAIMRSMGTEDLLKFADIMERVADLHRDMRLEERARCERVQSEGQGSSAARDGGLDGSKELACE